MPVPAFLATATHRLTRTAPRKPAALDLLCETTSGSSFSVGIQPNKAPFPRAAHKLWATEVDKGSIQPEGTQQRNVKKAAKPPKAT